MRTLARATIAAFKAPELEAVRADAAGCGAHMKAYGHLLRGDPAWAGRAAAFARKVVDVTEYLARAPLGGTALLVAARPYVLLPASPGARAAGPERAPRALARRAGARAR